LVPAIETSLGRRLTRGLHEVGDGELDNGKTRQSHPSAIDLGSEPPLPIGGSLRADFDRRRVWLSGTILTCFCGAALMEGAVFAALDDQARSPERVEPTQRGSIGNRVTARKSDLLSPVIELPQRRLLRQELSRPGPVGLMLPCRTSEKACS